METYTVIEIAEIMGVPVGKAVMAASRIDATSQDGAFSLAQSQLIINEIKEYL